MGEGTFFLEQREILPRKMEKNIQSQALPKFKNITKIKIQEQCYIIEDLNFFSKYFFERDKYITIWKNYLIAK